MSADYTPSASPSVDNILVEAEVDTTCSFVSPFAPGTLPIVTDIGSGTVLPLTCLSSSSEFAFVATAGGAYRIAPKQISNEIN